METQSAGTFYFIRVLDKITLCMHKHFDKQIYSTNTLEGIATYVGFALVLQDITW